MHNPPSDEVLMLRYREGDLSAFEELYRRHSGGLYRFLAWRSPRRDWVDEIAQDSWTGLHQARAQYQPQASFRTYLYQIARNRLTDLLRQPQALVADGSALDPPEPARQGADAELEARQRDRALHAAIHALPAEQKEALILQQFSGMSLEEIAALVAAPVETVKSRLRYAMRKLREHYAAAPSAREEQA
ncbi:sigma-70 family RNA polymerase sigma factor [Pseudoduganella namucuonensis]|uniref:RNA polymerase, sigma subunit, ECF family n=1 Tax=Pseudoduganella namucuonensis TaxID=1035707 RepID=A0A1I7M4K6_9BURK|nr:sigma-70 family RNA polymerase sigma factor [Pseudoduganella namucuonensis]SFV16868.1 RNA polymerase, sigma subunit, ECF family [Pseudoduganella namucuonensis]